VAFRFIAGNEHPDHDTIASFRRRFLKQIQALFVEVLKLAHEMGVLRLGTVALDGTKVHGIGALHWPGGDGRMAFHFLGPGHLDAAQAQRRSPSPHSKDVIQGAELAGL
jgi:hypothetical protein